MSLKFIDLFAGIGRMRIAFRMQAPTDKWLPLAKRILAYDGVGGISNAKIQAVIETCKGSARQITDAVIGLSLSASRKQSKHIVTNQLSTQT